MIEIPVYMKTINNNEGSRKVFSVISRECRIRRDNLTRMFSGAQDVQDLEKVLHDLEVAGLIRVLAAPIPELRIYYLALDGVRAKEHMRELRGKNW
jgi:hypothetical protein